MNINPSDYKILIVDDVMSNVLLLKVLLNNEKYQISTASNGRQALTAVETVKPDLILLDVMMPELDGFQTASIIKKNPETADIPIIFLTALNSTADIVRGFQVGANDFISKPFNKEELIIRVTHQISLIAAKRIILAQTEELQHTIFGRDMLYSVITNDLNAPMGSIKTILNQLTLSLSAEKIGDDMFESLKTANQTTEEVFIMLDNLLKWTKSQTGKLQVAHQDADIVELVKGVIQTLKIVAGLKGIQIRVEAPEKLYVYADSDLIATIVRNLTCNAIKFSHKDQEVLVTISKSDDMAIVSVQDHGCGIDRACQEKLLHADTHFRSYDRNNGEGKGLGLLLCNDFCQRNNGELNFESAVGKGSTFWFSVPLKKRE